MKPLKIVKAEKWVATLPLSFPIHDPISEGRFGDLLCKCTHACVPPVVALAGAGDCRTLGFVTLEACFDSEEEAKSAQTDQKFRRSEENVKKVIETVIKT